MRNLVCVCGKVLNDPEDECPSCGLAGEPTHEVPREGTTKGGGEPSQKDWWKLSLFKRGNRRIK